MQIKLKCAKVACQPALITKCLELQMGAKKAPGGSSRALGNLHSDNGVKMGERLWEIQKYRHQSILHRLNFVSNNSALVCVVYKVFCSYICSFICIHLCLRHISTTLQWTIKFSHYDFRHSLLIEFSHLVISSGAELHSKHVFRCF